MSTQPGTGGPGAAIPGTGDVGSTPHVAWPQSKAATAAWWLLPVCFLLWIFRDGLHAWFLADDFAWLSLLRLVRNQHDLLYEMFTPMAQGTIRPWSERGFFLGLEALFGLDSLPFRLVASLTAAADVLLIAWLTLRATGSRVAGFLAPVLWAANTALVRAMTWSSAYNELMCPLFLLSALALLIRYIETGRRRFWWAQLAVFVLGFGVLEINVVYPAIAAAWILFGPPLARERRNALLGGIAPLAAISVAYFVLHRIAAPLPVSGPYTLHMDASILKNLALYLKWTFAPEPLLRFGHRQITVLLIFLIGSLASLAFVVTELRRRRFLVLFFIAWFLVTLAPVLPLSGHLADYYLTIPAIGMAMLAATAAGRFWAAPWRQRILVAFPVLVYLWAAIPVTRAETHWWFSQSIPVRTLVLGVRAAKETHPGKAIVLDGVTRDLYNFSFAHAVFPSVGIDDVYLTPESELKINSRPGPVDLTDLAVSPSVLSHAITHNDVVVYSLESDHLRNITEAYARRHLGRDPDAPIRVDSAPNKPNEVPTGIDVGNILNSWLLGSSWLPPEAGIRWMPRSATLRLGVPQGGGSKLRLQGYCPESQLLIAPRHLMVLADGVVLGETRIYDPESNFQRLFPLSGVLKDKESVELEIRVDPVDRKDDQDYGLVFGKIEILP